MGLVFQDFLLFEELSAAANAALAGAYAPRAARPQLARRVQATLARLGLATGERRTVESFSGGERQRVAVARALANDPAIILADEPTASLDRAAADRLIDDLVALAHEGGKTLITVSHDPALHARMDRLVTIADGRLVDLMRTRGTRGNA
jgi:putative ABC transport system ATP-binding protein